MIKQYKVITQKSFICWRCEKNEVDFMVFDELSEFNEVKIKMMLCANCKFEQILKGA